MFSHGSLFGLLLSGSAPIFVIVLALAGTLLRYSQNGEGTDQLISSPGFKVDMPVATSNQPVEAIDQHTPVVISQGNRPFLVFCCRAWPYFDQMGRKRLYQFLYDIFIADERRFRGTG